MGRYIIDNPEPPGAMEQFRGNVNRLGQTMLQLKMAEIERKRKLEEDIAGEGRKMQGELGLLREKAKMEQESPLGMLEQRSKLASLIKDTGQDATPEQMDFLGINRPRVMSETPQVDMNAPLSVSATPMKSPVFGQGQGQMIPESGTIENTPFGSRMKDVKVFSPEAERQKNIIKEGAPLSAESGRIYSGALQGVRDIRKISDILGLTSGQINPKAKDLIYKANLSIEGGGAKPTIIPFGQGMYRGAKLLRGEDEGANLGNLFMTLSENLLRARTGAQAPDPEVVREHARSLLRGFIESPETWINKLKQNEEFLLGTAQQVKPTKWEQDLSEFQSFVFGNQSTQQQDTTGLRQSAIEELKRAGYPVTEKNISAVIQQLGE